MLPQEEQEEDLSAEGAASRMKDTFPRPPTARRRQAGHAGRYAAGPFGMNPTPLLFAARAKKPAIQLGAELKLAVASPPSHRLFRDLSQSAWFGVIALEVNVVLLHAGFILSSELR